MNCKSISVMSTLFLFLAYKINLLEDFITNFLFSDFDATSSHNFKKKSAFFVVLFPFEILSHFPNFDSSDWLREDVQRIIDKVQRNAYDFNGFDTCFSHFSTDFLGLAWLCCCFHKTFCDVPLMTLD